MENECKIKQRASVGKMKLHICIWGNRFDSCKWGAQKKSKRKQAVVSTRQPRCGQDKRIIIIIIGTFACVWIVENTHTMMLLMTMIFSYLLPEIVCTMYRAFRKHWLERQQITVEIDVKIASGNDAPNFVYCDYLFMSPIRWIPPAQKEQTKQHSQCTHTRWRWWRNGTCAIVDQKKKHRKRSRNILNDFRAQYRSSETTTAMQEKKWSR